MFCINHKDGRGPTQMFEPGPPVTLLRYCLGLLKITLIRPISSMYATYRPIYIFIVVNACVLFESFMNSGMKAT